MALISIWEQIKLKAFDGDDTSIKKIRAEYLYGSLLYGFSFGVARIDCFFEKIWKMFPFIVCLINRHRYKK